ncbi:MAG: hypothetical protein U1G05_09355 [Kiritimatiellia bacterium]
MHDALGGLDEQAKGEDDGRHEQDGGPQRPDVLPGAQRPFAEGQDDVLHQHAAPGVVMAFELLISAAAIMAQNSPIMPCGSM